MSSLLGTHYDEFHYVETQNQCPECKTMLTLVTGSTMLVCIKGHGPYFLA